MEWVDNIGRLYILSKYLENPVDKKKNNNQTFNKNQVYFIEW